jgi:hypothetical protein
VAICTNQGRQLPVFSGEASMTTPTTAEDEHFEALARYWEKKFDLLLIERDALAQKVEALESDSLKVDADRYQWLRTQNAHLESSVMVALIDQVTDEPVWVGSDLDAVVDSAMKAAS